MIQHKLREMRKAKGLSQEDLALDLHESQNTISNIETGKQKNINLQLLYKIASYFQVEPYELLTGNNNSITLRERPENKSIEPINLLMEQLKAKDKQLDEKDRQILKLLEMLELNLKVLYFT
jgi:putative transcriptional regulator